MVQHNLALACKAAEELRDLAPEQYAALGLSESEAARWQHLRRIIPWPRDPSTGHLSTDDTFHLLEPLCLHDSTLSFASHALFAAQNGLFAPAKEYLKKALLLDLRDIMGNTGKEGLHLACMGEAWQAVKCLKQAEERR